ncbi:MAG: Lpg1974 family pore-forming outer membrane protein [Legionellaceae bacterium]|nr:Lpg1974 family pore-forming outer membrane protein [Legionellaceae bacterium]
MLNLKKTAAAVLALSSSAVFAGTMGPVCSAVNVTVPCESTAWDVGARALYLQPVYSGGGYSYGAINNSDRFVDFNSTWGWGFMIEGSYHFETGSDANLNWYHFSRSGDKSYTVDNAGAIANLGSVVNTTTGNLSTDPSWDAVNLEFGQHVDFGEKKDIRFHGGVQYARIANTVKMQGTLTGTVTSPFITGGSASGTYVATFQRKPTYNGFGPRVGADMDYEWGNGLGVYANGAMALLAGSSKVSNSYTDNQGNSLQSSASKSTIAPELEAKLGLKYDYAVAQGDLTLDVGWMWVNYWNVNQSVAGIGPITTAQEGDFGVQGLYFGLKWLGNVA